MLIPKHPSATTKQRPNHPAGSPGAVDWRLWLGGWGLPPEVIKNIDRLARQYSPDQHRDFSEAAIMYLRGTDWHKKTFVGFAEAYKTGLVQDERGYRQYVQQANDLYSRYHGRAMTSAELVQSFRAGYDVNRLGRNLEGQAFIAANRGDIQYEQGAFGAGQLSEKELRALGQQQAGVGNALGENLIRRVGLAQKRMKRIFEGTLAGGSTSLETGILSSPSLRGGNISDIGR